MISASRTPPKPTGVSLGLRSRLATSIGLAALLALTACGGGQKPAAPPAPQVGYVTVSASSVPMITELPARTSAYEMSDVRPQVSGLIQKRLFTEGSLVRKGQPLYQIDPSQYRAAVAQARANLANAEATARDATSTAKASIDDATITAKVNATLAKDPDLSALKINVDTVGGKVTLNGPAPTTVARDRAETLAKSVEGVTAVNNQLVVTAS